MFLGHPQPETSQLPLVLGAKKSQSPLGSLILRWQFGSCHPNLHFILKAALCPGRLWTALTGELFTCCGNPNICFGDQTSWVKLPVMFPCLLMEISRWNSGLPLLRRFLPPLNFKVTKQLLNEAAEMQLNWYQCMSSSYPINLGKIFFISLKGKSFGTALWFEKITLQLN